MESLDLLRQMMELNYWARDRQLAACRLLTAEQLARPVGGSFGSLLDTLGHMVAVERIWLDRWSGEKVKGLWGRAELGSLGVIVERWRETEREMRGVVERFEGGGLEEGFGYENLRGKVCNYPHWQMLLHVLQHQAYHRGQVTFQLRLLGVDAPGVDYLVAVDERLGSRQ